MSTKELQQRLIENMRAWQKLENAQAELADSQLETTDNPLVAAVLEIIKRDSTMHHGMQQLVIDSLESEVVTMNPEEAQILRDQLGAHLRIEQQTLQLADENLAALAGQAFAVQEFLLDFLRRDEQKHRCLLSALDVFLSPQAGGE